MRGLKMLTGVAGATVLSVAAVLGMGMGSALACGGTFCDTSSPVNQTAERIIFVDREDGTVTAVVEIQYQGSAEQFSWVLPVPGIPEIGVSSTLALDRLQAATNPQYILNTEIEGRCAFDDNNDANNDANNNPFNNFDGDNNDVDVVGAGTVGPFDFEIISVDPELDNAADVAVQWLEENGYEVTPQTPDLLGPYLEEGMNLVGFRLTNGAGVESIRPIMMTYETADPMIPIRPTGVAANDDMGVMVFNVAPGRAVPSNYRHLILNEAAINWFNPNSNYRDVVNLAADEAGGQGFVTEMAAPSSDFDNTVLGSSDRAFISQFRGLDGTEDPVAIIRLSHSFREWDGYVDAFRLAWSGRTDLEFLIMCPECFFVEEEGVIPDFDVATFLTAMEDFVLAPMDDTQELLGSEAYLTRFFTTMSAFEMTKDPIFKVNAELPDVSNIHTATRTILCSPDVDFFQAPWRVSFDGVDVYGRNSVWPVGPDDLSANRRVEQLDAEGEPEVVTDNTETIRQQIVDAGADDPRSPASNDGDGGDDGSGGNGGSGGDDGGCSTASGKSPVGNGGALAALLLGLMVAARRRRW